MAKWTTAGEMTQPITIQQNQPTTDGYGEESPNWVTFATATAKIEQLSGRELFYAQQQVAKATHRVTLRYVPGLTPEMQLLWTTSGEGNRTLKIEDVDDVEGRGFELRLLAQELK